jgi:hypothetical protein
VKQTAIALLLLVSASLMTASAANAGDSPGVPRGARASIAGRRYFLVTEAGVRKTWMPVTDHMDQYIFVNSIGLMKNVGHRRAVGGSIDATLALGQLKFAPAVRYKQWLEKAGSLDLSLGWIGGNSRGAVGPVLNARYSPTTFFYVEGGLCRIQDQHEGLFYYPSSPYYADPARPHLNGFLGAGFGGRPGRIVWGAEVVGAGLLILMFSGMD